MKKYRTWYDVRIEEIDVAKETAKFVTYQDGQRWAKRSEDRYNKNHFDTWQEAREYLIGHEKAAIYDLELKIAGHVAMLKTIEEKHET